MQSRDNSVRTITLSTIRSLSRDNSIFNITTEAGATANPWLESSALQVNDLKAPESVQSSILYLPLAEVAIEFRKFKLAKKAMVALKKTRLSLIRPLFMAWRAIAMQNNESDFVRTQPILIKQQMRLQSLGIKSLQENLKAVRKRRGLHPTEVALMDYFEKEQKHKKIISENAQNRKFELVMSAFGALHNYVFEKRKK